MTPTAGETFTRGIDVDRDTKLARADPDCDGVCRPACVVGADCTTTIADHCGDGVCGGLESCQLWSADCGACTATCGDFVCGAGETAAACPGDC